MFLLRGFFPIFCNKRPGYIYISLINIYSVQVTCGTLGLSTATVKLVGDDGSTHIACSVGTGPVDSAYKAVDLIVKV